MDPLFEDGDEKTVATKDEKNVVTKDEKNVTIQLSKAGLKPAPSVPAVPLSPGAPAGVLTPQVEEDTNILRLMEEALVNKSGKKVLGKTVLEDKIIAFYFSAYWSPPCRDFVKLLRDFHKAVVQREAPFEIVFVSCDSSEEEMLEYFTTMHGDWWALPYDCTPRLELRSAYTISLVPKLVVLRPNGKVISLKGRKEVTDKKFKAFFSWYESSTLRSFTRSKYNLFRMALMEDEDKKTRALLRGQH